MMFKRPRLRPVRPLVNVGLAASLIFICACSKDEPPADGQSSATEGPVTVIETPERAKLQAVWATNGLEGEIVDVAVSGGPNPLLAAAMAGGAMQMFDLDGERLTEAVSLGVAMLADGVPATLNGLPVVLFPGIGTSGDLNIYLYSSDLGAPVAVDLLGEIGARGICGGEADAQNALLQIGYWTDNAPKTLIIGDLYEKDGEFLWEQVSTSTPDGPLGGCKLFGGNKGGVDVATGSASLGLIGIAERQTLLELREDGTLNKLSEDGSNTVLPIRAGISIGVPRPITAFATLPDAQFGGYPNGVIIVAGNVDGAQKLVFVEPIGLFDE